MTFSDILLDLNIQTEPTSEIDEVKIRRLVAAALSAEGITQPAEVGLTLADDATIQGMNRQYRGIDAPTDVLSFPLLEPWELGKPTNQPTNQPTFVQPPDGILHLGDVVVSLPRAKEQAVEYGHSLERELAYLIVHGVLHLLGYDHQDPEDKQQMREREESILTMLTAAAVD